VRTAPFRTSGLIGVPIAGAPVDPGIDVYIECLANARRLGIVTANPYSDWAFATVRIPPTWCPSEMRLVAKSTSTVEYVAVGTPYALSSFWSLRYSAVSMTSLHLIAFLLFALPVIGFALLLKTLGLYRVASLAAYATWLLFCYGLFFVTWWNPRAAAFFIWLFIGATLISIVWHALRSGPGIIAAEIRSLDLGTLYFGSLLMCALLWLAHPNGGLWDPAYRFIPAIWSSDHTLPIIVANGLLKGLPVKGLLGGGWHVSDRPPLLSGWLIVTRLGWQVVLASSGALALLGQAQVVAEIVCQCTVLVALRRALRLFPQRNVAGTRFVYPLAVIATIATPLLLFNLIYGWPKMLSAALGIFAMIAFFMVSNDSERWTLMERGALVVVAGACVALALLSHQGVVFGIVSGPLILIAMLGWRKTLRYGAPAFFIALLIMVPWLLWQAWIDPPGNALTKFALAGTFGMEHPEAPVSSVIVHAYRSLTLRAWIGMKAHAVVELLVPPEISWIDVHVKGGLERLRVGDFLCPLRSFALLIVPMLAAFVPRRLVDRLFDCSGSIRTARLFILTGLVGLGLNVLLTWIQHFTPHQSYLSLMFMLTGGIIALLSMCRRLAMAVLAAQLSYAVIVWIAEPLLFIHRVDPSGLVIAAAAVAALFYELNKPDAELAAPLA
jgi:hypothetical protein